MGNQNYVFELERDWQELLRTRRDLSLGSGDVVRRATLAYLSTAFSALNSPLYRLAHPFARELLACRFATVVDDVDASMRYDLSAADAEVWAAILIMRERMKPHAVSGHELIAMSVLVEAARDEEAPLATQLLIHARLFRLKCLEAKQRRRSYFFVRDHLVDIRDGYARIDAIGQGWKTYVRVARMTHEWRLMFYGMAHDRSPDLWAKSLAYFTLNFWRP